MDSKMVASIISTMTGNYCRDASMDHMHLQDMGSDAAVLLGYYEKLVRLWIKIHKVYVYFFTQILRCIYFAYNFTGNLKKNYQISSYESRCVAGWKRCVKKTLIQRWQ